METMPRKFFGKTAASIRTEADAINALDGFIRHATEEEVASACRELEVMAYPVRSIIRGLLWKLEYPLDSQEFLNCFELTWAAA